MGHAVRDGGEAEGGEAVKGVGATRAEEAAAVIVGVDEGDVEGAGMEELCDFEHGVHMALGWVGDAHYVWLF